MPATYEPIATTTLSSAAASITFSSISGSYTDLVLSIITKNATSNANLTLRFNSDTGTNYSITDIEGDGTSVISLRGTNATRLYINNVASASTSNFLFSKVNIFSYAGSTNKTVLSEGSVDKNGSGGVERTVGLWRNTSAITTIAIALDDGTNLATGSTATLYGILKA